MEHSKDDRGADEQPSLTLLVVEDDHDLAAALMCLFTTQGWRAHVAASINGARHLLSQHSFDCAVLDRGLPMNDGEEPSADGLSLMPDLRAARTPVMILSAIGDVAQRIHGLGSGASDYLVKPFDELELVARLRAIRRLVEQHDEHTLKFHGLLLKLNERIALLNNERLELGAKEFALLAYLAMRRPAVATKAMLIRDVWKLSFDPGTNVVEVTIKRLRDRLQAAGASPMIETIKGQPMQQRPGGWRVVP